MYHAQQTLLTLIENLNGKRERRCSTYVRDDDVQVLGFQRGRAVIGCSRGSLLRTRIEVVPNLKDSCQHDCLNRCNVQVAHMAFVLLGFCVGFIQLPRPGQGFGGVVVNGSKTWRKAPADQLQVTRTKLGRSPSTLPQ